MSNWRYTAVDNFTRQIVHFIKCAIKFPEEILTVLAYPAMTALELNVVVLRKDGTFNKFSAAAVEIEDDFDKYVEFIYSIINEINK